MKFSSLYRRIILPLVLLVAVLALVPLFVLHAPPFLDLRQSVAAQLIADILVRRAEVHGEVNIELGAVSTIKIHDVRLSAEASQTAKLNEHADRIDLSFSPFDYLEKGIEVSALTIEGVQFAVVRKESAGGQLDGDAKISLDELARLPAGFLSRPMAKNMRVRDLTITFVGEETGWKETLFIKDAHSRVSETGNEILIDVNGAINSAPLTINGKFPNPQVGKTKGPFAIGLSVSSVEASLSGAANLSQEIAIIDAEFKGAASSVPEFLKLFGLSTESHSSSRTTAKLRGPLNHIVADDVNSVLDIEGGYYVTVLGRVGNLNRLDGFDLQVVAAAPKPEPKQERLLLDLDVAEVTGVVSGSVEALTLEKFQLITTAGSAEFNKIGPITVARVAKGANGELRLEGIRVLSGPPERRHLDLTGQFLDLLSLDLLELEGKFDVPTAAILDEERDEASRLLGRMVGRIEVSGKQGDFHISKFTAAVEDSRLLSLAVRLPEGQDVAQAGGVMVEMSFTINDFAKLAEAFGPPVQDTGPVSFDGSLFLSNAAPKIEGIIGVGKTKTEVKLIGSADNKSIDLDGKVTTKLLYLEDLHTVLDLFEVSSEQDLDTVTVSEKLTQAVKVKVEVKVERIAQSKGRGKTAGKISGAIDYQDGVLRLDPFDFSYLGGTIATSLQSDLRKSPPAHTLQGKVSKLNLGSLLREMKISPFMTGTAYLNFKLRANGESLPQMQKSLSGTLRGSLWGGSIGTELLDLSGLNLLTWLGTSSKAKGVTPLVCMVVPVDFKQGRGVTGSAVIETKNVQAAGAGSIDLRNEKVDLKFLPRPKIKQVIDLVTPFRITGPLSSPDVVLEQGSAAGRVVGEIASLPFNILGGLFVGGKKKAHKGKPCVIKTKLQPDRRRRM